METKTRILIADANPDFSSLLSDLVAGEKDMEVAGAADNGVDALEATVTDVIHEIGVPAHIKGYQYLREAIILTIRDMDMINAIPRLRANTQRRPRASSAPSATQSRWPGTAAT